MTRIVAAILLLCSLPLLADPPKEADLAARVAALEKKVAGLEALLKSAPAPDPAKTDIASKVIGIWAVADDDRKDAIFTDLVLKGDGMCEFVPARFSPQSGNYKVVGRQLAITTVGQSWSACRVASATESELVLEHETGDTVRKIKYKKEK